MSPLQIALADAIKEQRSDAIIMSTVTPTKGAIEEFLATLFGHGYIVVRNEEPAQSGFNCHVCGCEFGGYEP